MSSPSSAPAEIPSLDLFGWDTAFVISLTKANEAIKTLKSSPTTFEFTETSKTNTVEATIKGTWGDWSISPNEGGDQNIVMKCPITSGTFTSATDPGTSFDLSNTYVEVEFKLTYQQQAQITSPDPTAKAGTGVQHNLVPRTQTSDPTNDPVVSIKASSYQFPKGNDPDIAKAICDEAFRQWFEHHLDQFQHVFSIFVVNQTADKDAFQWLKPTGTPSYATAITGDPDTSVLAVLAMTENRTAPPGNHQVDERMLSLVGKHAAFAISGPRFVEKWLLQGLLTMRLGTSKNDYDASDDGLSWQNKNPIQWATFPDKDGHPTPASIDKGNFSISLERDHIIFSFTNLTWVTGDGLTAHVNYSESFTLSLKSGTDTTGKPYKNVVTLERAPHTTPALTYTTTVAEARTIASMVTNVVLSIVGAIVGGLAGGVLDGATEAVGEAIDVGVSNATQLGEDTFQLDVEAVVEGVAKNVDPEQMSEVSLGGAQDGASDVDDALQGEQQGESQATIGSKIVGKLQTFGRNLWANKFKFIGGMIGGGIGAALGSIPMILTALEQAHFSDIPNLEEFAANCVESVHWPNAGGFTLTSAMLSGAVVLGGDLTPATPSRLAARVPVAVAVPAAASSALVAAPAAASSAAFTSPSDIGSEDTSSDDTSADDTSADDTSADDAEDSNEGGDDDA